MGRFYGGGSYGHSIRRIADGHYRLSWTVDRYYQNSRMRHPRTATRDTDTAGAERFAKRWDIAMPNVELTGAGTASALNAKLGAVRH